MFWISLAAVEVLSQTTPTPTPTPIQTTVTGSFESAAIITIPSVGAAAPYPATINVSGMPGTITQAIVRLNCFNHTFPNDVDALLVGPAGQKVMLMSDAGGGFPVNAIYLTLSDAASTSLPQNSALTSGTFRPTDYADGADTFPAPAPAGPYGNVLSVLNGQSANGTWSFYVRDDGSGDQGSFAGGWRLTFTTTSDTGSGAPIISDIGDQMTRPNAATLPLPFTINDPDTPVANLTLTASSSDQTLVPPNNIVFGGSGSNRTVTVTPGVDQIGTTTITVIASDGLNSGSNYFVLTVANGSIGLVAAYGFDEGIGTTTADLSGTGNPGTITGPTWTTSGKFGSALTFNGTSGWVRITDSASLHLTIGSTLEAWVYPFSIPPSNCTGTNCRFMDVIMKDSDRYYLLASSDNLQRPEAGGIFTTGKHILYGPGALAINTWTHLAIAYDSTTLRLYVNGLLVSAAPETALITTSTNPLYIGGDQTMGQYFNGRIDEVRVYNRGLGAGEIQADMNIPIVSPTPTPSPTPTATATFTPIASATSTATATATATATFTPTATATATFTPTPTATATETATATATFTPTATATDTPTATATATFTPTVEPTATATTTPTATATATPLPNVVSISGNVFYCMPASVPIQNATLMLIGDATISISSDDLGYYEFSTLAVNGNYEVTPTKESLVPGSSAIDTVDVIATQRHFLNLVPLAAGCPAIAADVNRDNTISTVDVIGIQRFFLGLSTGIGDVGKYHFDPINRSYSDIVTDQTGQDYDGFVFGDVVSMLGP